LVAFGWTGGIAFAMDVCFIYMKIFLVRRLSRALIGSDADRRHIFGVAQWIFFLI